MRALRYIPLLHLAGGHVNVPLLPATTHRKESIEKAEAMTLVALGNNIECDRVLEDVIVEGEFTAGDEVHALGLDSRPVGLPDLSSDVEELSLRQLATPVYQFSRSGGRTAQPGHTDRCAGNQLAGCLRGCC